MTTLPLTTEAGVWSRHGRDHAIVIGVDEAGRGPLAGPVVAAAFAYLPPATGKAGSAPPPPPVAGIVDSKAVTEEDEREALYATLTSTPRCYYASAVVDHTVIDRINILQATFLAMDRAVASLVAQLESAVGGSGGARLHVYVDGPHLPLGLRSMHVGPPAEVEARAAGSAPPAATAGRPAAKRSRRGSGVASAGAGDAAAATGGGDVADDGGAGSGAGAMPTAAAASSSRLALHTVTPVIGGDSKVYSIAAASVVAKVTRDRLMHIAHAQWPQYGFAQHKGYGTAAHMEAIRVHKPSPIHRLTFAPVKTWFPELAAAAGVAKVAGAGGKRGTSAAAGAARKQGAAAAASTSSAGRKRRRSSTADDGGAGESAAAAATRGGGRTRSRRRGDGS